MAKSTAKYEIRNSYTISGAADLAGVVEGTIRAAIKRGELLAISTKDKRAKLVPQQAIKQWIKDRA